MRFRIVWHKVWSYWKLRTISPSLDVPAQKPVHNLTSTNRCGATIYCTQRIHIALYFVTPTHSPCIYSCKEQSP